MRSLVPLLLLFVFSLAVLAGCGEEAEAPAVEPAAPYLAATINGVDRSSEPKTFVGEDLYEHINGGAELYHLYDFVEVATALYARDSVEVSVDIYEFADADNAFGLYSSLRPDEPEFSPLGVEGFAAGNSAVFVKGPFVVSITGYDESDQTKALIALIAPAIEDELSGTADLPETFGLFPGMFGVDQSERIIAGSFMGRQFLTDVYSQDFVLDGDTLRLLLTEDRGGAKYLQWSTSVEADSAAAGSLAELPFDDGNVFAFRSDYYGTIVAGLNSGYLAGVINYSDKHEDFLLAWLEEMPH
ncbi:MAG: hypothetical protein GY867_12980, partial [bacterium]|nr:hypothetical protein [bacterium]